MVNLHKTTRGSQGLEQLARSIDALSNGPIAASSKLPASGAVVSNSKLAALLCESMPGKSPSRFARGHISAQISKVGDLASFGPGHARNRLVTCGGANRLGKRGIQFAGVQRSRLTGPRRPVRSLDTLTTEANTRMEGVNLLPLFTPWLPTVLRSRQRNCDR